MSSSSSQTPWPTVKSGPSRPEILQVRGLRLAVALQADDHLRLGFLHVAVQPDVELARQRRRTCA